MCHVDDSIILGTWMQDSDHKTIEDQVCQREGGLVGPQSGKIAIVILDTDPILKIVKHYRVENNCYFHQKIQKQKILRIPALILRM